MYATIIDGEVLETDVGIPIDTPCIFKLYDSIVIGVLTLHPDPFGADQMWCIQSTRFYFPSDIVAWQPIGEWNEVFINMPKGAN